MADETIAEKGASRIEKAIDTVAKPVEVTAASIEQIPPKAVAAVKSAPAARRVGKGAKAAFTKVRKVSRKAARPVTRMTQAAVAATTPQIERNDTMAYDFTKLFTSYELPGTERFQNLFTDASERGQEMVRRTQKTTEEMVEIAKANVEALTEAGRIAAAGARNLGQDMLASGREGFEQASTAVKTLADAKSPTEFLQIQSEMARASFDRAVAEGSKFAEAFVKLAGEAVQPLSNRATLNAERLSDIAA